MSDAKPVALTVLDNGPLKVSAKGLTLRYCGESVDISDREQIFLCRCGHSSNPPFCDNTHKTRGFVADPAEGEPKAVKVWEGRKLRTFFNPNTCMHAFYCKPLKELRERELAGDDEAGAEIARVVLSCPSGALSYESTDHQVAPSQQEADIEIMEGGELRMQCAFEINADRNERQADDRATLCRCGLSKNKPWCDGRHKKRTDFR